MPPLVPNRFLVRVAYPCRFVKGIPHEDADELLDLSESCRIDNFAAMDEQTNFADVRLAWNEFGLGVQATVKGKDKPPEGDPGHPRASDGLTLWIDTRGDRSGHRATRTCHQFHFLPAAVLTGFDPEEHPRWGFTYVVHDRERGNQVLSVGTDFPVAEDPSLWSVLELVK